VSDRRQTRVGMRSHVSEVQGLVSYLSLHFSLYAED
jgi:hypothetical protein